MRTRGKGEGLIEHKENMRFGWALPNTRCLRILTFPSNFCRDT